MTITMTMTMIMTITMTITMIMIMTKKMHGRLRPILLRSRPRRRRTQPWLRNQVMD